MSNFDLRRHYPSEVSLSISEDAHEEPFKVEANVSVAGGPNTASDLNWRVATTVAFKATSKTGKVAEGKVTFVGYFDISPEVPADKRAQFMVTQGTSILYAATREWIANQTARAPGKLIILPPTIFQDLAIKKNPNAKEIGATKA
jgi:preprotein translocase subunit SecB